MPLSHHLFFLPKYHHNPQLERLARHCQKKEKIMAFYDTCRKGCFFVLGQKRYGHALCRKKSMPHTLKHDPVFFLFFFFFFSLPVCLSCKNAPTDSRFAEYTTEAATPRFRPMRHPSMRHCSTTKDTHSSLDSVSRLEPLQEH